MGYQLKKQINVSALAAALELEWTGENNKITSICSLNDTENYCLTFSKNQHVDEKKITVICDETQIENKNENGYILSSDPRYDFVRALSYLKIENGFATWNTESIIHPTTSIGKNVVIESGCSIGSNTTIEANTVIHQGTRIGMNCLIRSGANIGGDGFGFVRDQTGRLLRFIHLGGVKIGNEVEIGALNSIARGTLNDTIIENGVKTDNLVHIAHNCHIGCNSLITACVELSGGVIVGKNVWIGPNSSVLEKIKIGDNAFIGIGSVVTKDVDPSIAVAGNPSRRIKRV